VQPLIREGSRSSASFRHQVFSTSRRLSPHSGLRAYSIPLPRPGFPPVQGLLSPRSSPSLIGRSCPLAVASRSTSPTCAGCQRSRPRLRGLHPREAAFDAESLFTTLRAAPLLGFISSRLCLLSVGRSLPTSSAHDVPSPRLRFRDRASTSSTASLPKEAGFASPRSQRLLEISSLLSKPPCS
jgi:hypothetical protein